MPTAYPPGPDCRAASGLGEGTASMAQAYPPGPNDWCKETLRRWPPAVGVFTRENTTDVEIDGWPLKKGSLVHILSYVVHHYARWFPEPTRFDPDRFLPEHCAWLPQFAYFPFGSGPRGCIGNTFATLEMMLVAASILQRFDLSLAPGQEEPELLTPRVPVLVPPA